MVVKKEERWPPKGGQGFDCGCPDKQSSHTTLYRGAKFVGKRFIIALALVLGMWCVCYQWLGHTHYKTWNPNLPMEGASQSETGEVFMDQHLPQCIIVGVRKCGTRALLEFLSLHPDVQVAREEIHFFDKDENYRQGLEWYRRKMPYTRQGQLTLEKSPGYFINPQAPLRIRHMNSSIRLLVIVRDPVVRTISDYTQIYSYHQEKNESLPSFEERVLDPSSGEINLDYKAIWISQYDLHLMQWVSTFNHSQIHFVDGDQMVKDPLLEIQKVEDFLGIRHYITKDNFYWNSTKGFYCMVNDTQHGRCLVESKGCRHPSVDPKVVDKLRRFFRPHSRKFAQLSHKSFDWANS